MDDQVRDFLSNPKKGGWAFNFRVLRVNLLIKNSEHPDWCCENQWTVTSLRKNAHHFSMTSFLRFISGQDSKHSPALFHLHVVRYRLWTLWRCGPVPASLPPLSRVPVHIQNGSHLQILLVQLEHKWSPSMQVLSQQNTECAKTKTFLNQITGFIFAFLTLILFVYHFCTIKAS